MIPAFGMVILPQNLSTGDGKIPGCSCIRSVATSVSEQRKPGDLQFHAGVARGGQVEAIMGQHQRTSNPDDMINECDASGPVEPSTSIRTDCI